MQNSSSTAQSSPPGATLYGMYILSLLVCGVGNLLIRMGARGGWLPPSGRAVLAVLTAAPLAIAAILFWRMLARELDEMMRKIVLDGLAIALTIYLPLSALYVNLRTAGVWTPRLDPPDIILTPAILVAIGIAVARRRYR